MFANSGGRNHVELFKSDDTIDPRLPSQQANQVNEKIRTSVIRESYQIIETFARPVFAEHLLFRDQNDLAAATLALANEIRTFKISGETDDVEGAGS